SSRGSNLAALIDAERAGVLGGTIVAVLCNRAGVPALDIATAHGIATVVIEHGAHADRNAFDTALADAIDATAPDLIVLAGFMRVLGTAIVVRYQGRMLNVHPSLLPSYPGLYTHRRALADGVRIHGCTVHFVTGEVDHGPIVMQGAVAVHDGDDEAALAARGLAVEHRLLPAAVGWHCAGRLAVAAGRVRVDGTPALADVSLMVPPPDAPPDAPPPAPPAR
ncbi:MAG: phosphoribosylglycinamide formyltransferase, partial [Betaproteobacteria bacterium]